MQRQLARARFSILMSNASRMTLRWSPGLGACGLVFPTGRPSRPSRAWTRHLRDLGAVEFGHRPS